MNDTITRTIEQLNEMVGSCHDSMNRTVCQEDQEQLAGTISAIQIIQERLRYMGDHYDYLQEDAKKTQQILCETLLHYGVNVDRKMPPSDMAAKLCETLNNMPPLADYPKRPPTERIIQHLTEAIALYEKYGGSPLLHGLYTDMRNARHSFAAYYSVDEIIYLDESYNRKGVSSYEDWRDWYDEHDEEEGIDGFYIALMRSWLKRENDDNHEIEPIFNTGNDVVSITYVTTSNCIFTKEWDAWTDLETLFYDLKWNERSLPEPDSLKGE